jgi:hypothetical protein
MDRRLGRPQEAGLDRVKTINITALAGNGK